VGCVATDEQRKGTVFQGDSPAGGRRQPSTARRRALGNLRAHRNCVQSSAVAFGAGLSQPGPGPAACLPLTVFLSVKAGSGHINERFMLR
jgi:hypothetical protein